MKNIAVVGATGLLGKPVTFALVNAGFTVKALVRNTARAATELPTEVALVEGDLKNLHDLEQTFAGCDAIYINLSVKNIEKPTDWHAETDGVKLIIEAARKTNIKKLALISSLVHFYQGMNGFDWWAFKVKQQSVKLVKESGIPYTIFYPSTFMENFYSNYKKGKYLVLAGKSEHKQYFIAAADYGLQVARSFQRYPNENKEYAIQGLEGFTTDEAYAVFKQHYKKEKLGIMRAPVGLIKFFGLFAQGLNYGSKIIEALNKYPEKFQSEQTWEELGKPVITLKEFAATQ
ncbi:MAG: NAD(P)H-binding protein [Cyclobacteriaceae bacterium]|nr:NAD(P)H-binding protein [Cyclobacteriaceae bacterium]UYN88592.1 MAG: NAD(P)H-binding protein [Cyclobacteriaceae bacterium]